MESYFNEVYDSLNLCIRDVKNENTIDYYNLIIEVIESKAENLKDHLKVYKFKSEREEIDYFRYKKPNLIFQLIYYKKLLHFEMLLPFGQTEQKIEFYQKELNQLTNFFNDNATFVQYIRSNKSDFDETYFTRSKAKRIQVHESLTCEIDYQNGTGYDYKLAIIMANEKLEGILNEKIDALKNPSLKNNNQTPSQYDTQVGRKKLNWSISQSDLVELIYGLHSSRAFNNGSTDIKEITAYFESVFNIKLNNVYRTFLDIKKRKSIDRFSFISSMGENLEQLADDKFYPNE